MAEETAELGFQTPSRNSVLQSLVNTFGRERAKELWREACYKAGTNRDCNTLEELEQVAKTLSAMSGAAGVVGKSLSVRIITYKTMKNS